MSIERAQIIRATALVLAMNTLGPSDIPPIRSEEEEEEEEENGTNE